MGLTFQGPSVNKISVIYFSGYGHTARQANVVVEGLQSAGQTDVTTIVIDADGNIDDGAWLALEASDAIVFGCPTYMGNVPWQFKRFADASSKPWFARHWRDKVAAGFTNSGAINGDKHSTLSYLFTLSMQHAMVWVGPDLMPANTLGAKRDDVNYLGSFAGAMAQSPVDAPADSAPGPGDLHTARLFGERVALLTSRFHRG